jgi:hypothetical protein
MEMAIFSVSLLAVSFLIAYISVLYKLKAANQALAQMVMIYNTMREISSPSNEDIDIHKENFIKFLSDSREWAFGYIEEVQSGLKKFVDEIEPEITYYDKYGVAVEGMVSAHDKALKKISNEFKELKKLLPEESNDRR